MERITCKRTIIGLLVSVFFVVAITALSFAQGAVSLPRTGETFCYDVSGVFVPCPGTGQDGAILAGISWPTPRFVTNGDGTITDSLTGLTWLTDANCIATSYPSFDSDGDYTGDGKVIWQHAHDFVVGMNGGTYPLCAKGHSDWRVPNVNELESLINAGVLQSSPWLMSQGFTNVQYDRYWSSTSYGVDPADWAWFIHLRGNSVGLDNKPTSNFLWPVRGVTSGPAQIWQTGQMTSYATGDDGDLEKGVTWTRTDVGRFRNPDGSYPITEEEVLDTLTGLIWTRDAGTPGPPGCSPGTDKSWQSALDHVACLNANNYLGSQQWRLPNRKEIFSLFNFGTANMANWFLFVGFTNVKGGPIGLYWTSTTLDDFRTYANGGYVGWEGQVGAYVKTGSNYIWPVRSGDVSILGTADLSLLKTDTPDPVTVYQNLTYNLVVTNSGPDAATGVGVTDTLPPEPLSFPPRRARESASGLPLFHVRSGPWRTEHKRRLP